MSWQQRQNILWAKRQFHPMWECREDRKYYDDVDEQEDGKRRSHSFASPRCIGFGSIFPSRFQKLARLNFKVNKSNLHVLQALLLVAPDLEVLVLDKCIGFGSIYPSRFQNLVRLDFQVNKCNWHVLQALLLVAPHLEVLVLHKVSKFGRLDFQVNKCNWHVLQALLLVAPHLEVLVLHKVYIKTSLGCYLSEIVCDISFPEFVTSYV
ncbi:hypothetical protein CFP56_006067 [Quercus suber]|uniref:Uncharacterized protein n=1 Tax=Quercus suber TaxID=58331 RepID=A0AAW0L934_QUESU